MLSFLKKLFPSTPDIASLVKKGGIIVDVRTKAEFQTGHIKGSLNVPLDALKNELTRLKKLGHPIITVCQSGNRSRMAKSLLQSAGMEGTNGGGWKSVKAKLPGN